MKTFISCHQYPYLEEQCQTENVKEFSQGNVGNVSMYLNSQYRFIINRSATTQL